MIQTDPLRQIPQHHPKMPTLGLRSASGEARAYPAVELLRAGAAGGAEAATLEVRAADRATHRVYGRLGFSPAGIRPAYYSAPTDDAVIMWLHELSSSAAQARIDAVAATVENWEATA